MPSPLKVLGASKAVIHRGKPLIAGSSTDEYEGPLIVTETLPKQFNSSDHANGLLGLVAPAPSGHARRANP